MRSGRRIRGARSFCTKSVDRLLLACYDYPIAKV
nr:MAG TPA: hypothetical protein [Caudoviricetes sp.]